MKKIIVFICFLFCTCASLAAKQKSYQNLDFSQIDNYVLKAPIIDDERDLDQLVYYLTKQFRDDLPKARAIFSWIVYNIDYDDYEARFNDKVVDKGAEFEYLGSILETRSGVCRDIANLYDIMAKKAGLKTTLVKGIAGRNLTKKNAKYNQHVWLVIDIDGEWEYLDPTWAIQGQKSFQEAATDRQYRREMKKRLKNKDRLQPRKERFVGNTYFLADKEEFSKTHFPDEDKWQLQRRPISYSRFISGSQK